MRYLYGSDRYREDWRGWKSGGDRRVQVGKRKYNRGRRKEGQWVLGGVERGSDEVFMQITSSRDAATLLPVIIANVKPGTEIQTDEWRFYARLNRRGYVHHTVNHTIEFVNLVHTHNLLSVIPGTCKEKVQENARQFKSTLFHILSAWNLYGEEDTPFAMFMNCITVVYPL